jgi:hypothetical protein
MSSYPNPIDERARQRALELADYDESIFMRFNDCHRHERFTRADVILALDASAGLVAMAARRLNCSPTTIRSYAARYPAVRAALTTIRAELCDLALAKIVQMIRDGNLAATIWYLRTFAADRGYGHRPPKPAPVKAVPIKTTVPWAELDLSPRQMRTLVAALEAGQQLV